MLKKVLKITTFRNTTGRYINKSQTWTLLSNTNNQQRTSMVHPASNATKQMSNRPSNTSFKNAQKSGHQNLK